MRPPEVSLGLAPVYNLCPTQKSPVLRVVDGERRLGLMRWQLVSNAEPAFNTRLSTFNARSESVFESPLYREPVLRRRCIVPLSGFYEWKMRDRTRPFRIHLRDEPIMSVAGVWETWRPGTIEAQHSFSILTTSANDFLREIHNRMPVILGRGDEDAWLDPTLDDQQSLQRFLKPCPSEWLNAVPVSTLVNSPKNNSPALLEPVAQSRLFDF